MSYDMSFLINIAIPELSSENVEKQKVPNMSLEKVQTQKVPGMSPMLQYFAMRWDEEE